MNLKCHIAVVHTDGAGRDGERLAHHLFRGFSAAALLKHELVLVTQLKSAPARPSAAPNTSAASIWEPNRGFSARAGARRSLTACLSTVHSHDR
jgi:hypothetical protein